MEKKRGNKGCADEQVTARDNQGSIPLGSLERDRPTEGRGHWGTYPRSLSFTGYGLSLECSLPNPWGLCRLSTLLQPENALEERQRWLLAHKGTNAGDLPIRPRGDGRGTRASIQGSRLFNRGILKSRLCPPLRVLGSYLVFLSLGCPTCKVGPLTPTSQGGCEM